MSPGHFFRVVRAELRKVYTRPMGLANLVVAVLVGLVVALLINKLDHADSVHIMDKTLGDMVTPSATSTGGWALWTRGFFVQPLFLILATTTAIASEHADRTLREVLVRPVPRWAVLASRVVAMTGLAAVTLLLTFVSSMAIAVPLFGFPESPDVTAATPSVGALVLGYCSALLGDVALITWTVALSLLVRSAGMVLVVMAMVLMVDFAIFGALLAGAQLQVEIAQTLLPWTLYSTLHAWQGYETGWDPQPFLLLGLYTAVAGAVAWARFSRLDVP